MSAVKRYRKLPVVIEAIEVTDEFGDVIEFLSGTAALFEKGGPDGAIIKIPTLEGLMTASEGDFIIKGVNGEFYPCKPDIFAKTYEEVFVVEPGETEIFVPGGIGMI